MQRNVYEYDLRHREVQFSQATSLNKYLQLIFTWGGGGGSRLRWHFQLESICIAKVSIVTICTLDCFSIKWAITLAFFFIFVKFAITPLQLRTQYSAMVCCWSPSGHMASAILPSSSWSSTSFRAAHVARCWLAPHGPAQHVVQGLVPHTTLTNCSGASTSMTAAWPAEPVWLVRTNFSYEVYKLTFN